jgi:4-diphosphocytidyl-2-C-methyl-D-erythritol kinase
MTVTEKAYAKINLFLDVTGRRDDGFHDVITVMHSVSLCDVIELTAIPSSEGHITITSSDPTLPTDDSNLIYKSARKFMSHFDINDNIEIRLDKRIPIGAGLGGGSSDAAATLRALNKIYRSATKEQMLQMAAELGSDVPFCIDGGCATCTGRGENVHKSDCNFKGYYRYIVIAIGESRVSTPKAYGLLDEKYGDFQSYNKNKSLSDMRSIPIYNIFESVIHYDEIDKIKEIMLDSGARDTLMSGSGQSVFGGFKNIFSASIAEKKLKKEGYSAYKCRLI